MKPKTPSPAKITAPRLPEVLVRKRLFRMLDRAAGKPVTWISGPAGSGKTTLAASYLSARRRPVLWYHLDAGDADAATFFYYLGLAAKNRSPHCRTPLPLLTPEYLPGLAVFTKRYFESLFQRLPRPFTLVFDNFHEVAPESTFDEILREGLLNLPEKCRALVLSRTPPPPGMARLAAHEDMELLEWEDLGFTEEELKQFVRLRSREKMTVEEVRALHRETGGWAAGLVLMLAGRRKTAGGSQPAGSAALDTVFDYFAGELFEKTDAKTKDFLLRTAFLPRMTAKMAGRVSDRADAGEILSDLNRRNFFTLRNAEAEPAYQYHDLFRAFLLSRAASALPPAQLNRLRHIAAAILAETGRIEAAADLLYGMCDWPGLSRLIEENAANLFQQGRSKTLQEWIGRLPRTLLDQSPWLVYWQGLCRLPLDTREARGLFEQAFRLFNDLDDHPGSLLAWAGAVSSIWYEQDDLTRLDPWIAWLDDRLRKTSVFPNPDIEAQVTCAMVSALLFRQPLREDLQDWIDRAQAIAGKTSQAGLKVQIRYFVGFHYLWRGLPSEGWTAIKEMGKEVKSSELTPLTFLTFKLVEGFYHWTLVSPDRCLETANEGLAVSRASGVHIQDYWFLAMGVYATLSKGEVKQAEGLLEKMRALMGRTGRLNVAHYHMLAGWKALSKGEPDDSLSHAEEALRLAAEAGAPLPEALSRIGLAQSQFELGEGQSADTHLDQALRIARSAKSLFIELIYWMTASVFSMSRGPEEQTLDFIRKALAMGRRQGFITATFWRPDAMARLLAKALENGIEPEYARNLIRIHHLKPSPTARDSEHWPWPVRIQALGGFTVLRDGKPLRFSRKTQRKPLGLLKALIAFGGREVTEEQLTEALWPDSEGDAAHRALTSALHRLRQLLGDEEAVLLQDGRLTLNPKRCFLDVWAFDRLLAQFETDARCPSPDGNRIGEEVNRAMDLYKGPFLGEDASEHWAIPQRERYRAKITRLITDQGRLWEEAGRWEKAVDCYRKGLEVDPLAEEFYRRMMIALRRLGRRAEALAVYLRLRRILSSMLQVDPSPETDAIYRTLLKK